MTPAPRTRVPGRVPKGEVVTDAAHPPENKLNVDQNGSHPNAGAPRKVSAPELSSSPKVTTFLRRRSSGNKGSMDRGGLALPLRSDDPDVKQHLKHLGPSNAANRPKSTRINTVKIKPGGIGIPNTIPEDTQRPKDGTPTVDSHAPQGGIGEGLLENAGREASDGVHTIAVGYGTMQLNSDRTSWKDGKNGLKPAEEEPASPKSTTADENTKLIIDNTSGSKQRSKSVSTIGSLHSVRSQSPDPPKKRQTARSGSISENIVDLNGVRKIVLETTSSSDSEEKGASRPADRSQEQDRGTSSEADPKAGENEGGKKKKRKKRGKKKKNGGESSESQPLLGGDRS